MDKKLPDVRPVYTYIVDSVIANARAHFLQDGVDEYVAFTYGDGEGRQDQRPEAMLVARTLDRFVLMGERRSVAGFVVDGLCLSQVCPRRIEAEMGGQAREQ